MAHPVLEVGTTFLSRDTPLRRVRIKEFWVDEDGVTQVLVHEEWLNIPRESEDTLVTVEDIHEQLDKENLYYKR